MRRLACLLPLFPFGPAQSPRIGDLSLDEPTARRRTTLRARNSSTALIVGRRSNKGKKLEATLAHSHVKRSPKFRDGV